MKKVLLLSVGILMIVWTSQAQQPIEKFHKVKEMGGIEEYVYRPNELQILLLQDNSAPVATVQIVYRVGSKHEVPGNTGSTHLLEHLNFKGTEMFNKQKGTSIDQKLNEIGAQMNATTWYDRTNYFETIPSDKIGLALEIEADRMRNSLLLEEDKEAEMTVVRNEFERGENNPNSVLSKEIWSVAYMAHPYHHSTIGWRSDIENMPIEVLRKFYDTYYWPNNATLTIIGDFQKESLLGLVDKYFGKVGKAPHEIPQPYTEEPTQYGPRKVIVKKPGQVGVISIGYKIPGRMHEDLPALTVLGEYIGSGASSIINREFVDKEIAYYGYAGVSQFKEAGLFTISLGIAPESDFSEVNQKMVEALSKIKKEGVTQDDIDRIVAKLEAQTILGRDGSSSIASELNEAIAGGDWTDFVTGSEKLRKVTVSDVQYVAEKYLEEDQSTTGYFIPDDGEGNDGVGKGNAMNHTDPENGKVFFRSTSDSGKGDRAIEVEKQSLGKFPRPIPLIRGEKGHKSEMRFVRKKVMGIDALTAKTGAKDLISVSASLPIGDYFAKGKNSLVPSLTASLLSKGTTKNDKFQFSQKLERLGVSINVRADVHTLNIDFKCLKKDFGEVMELMAEELRYPLLDGAELEIIKTQTMGSLKQGQSNPGYRGGIALSQAIYPKGHPNFRKDVETSITDLGKVDIEKIKEFHKEYFGPAGMRFVAVGDIDHDLVFEELQKVFQHWQGGINKGADPIAPETTTMRTEVVSIPQKPSAELFIGLYTGIKRSDDDYLPFYVANSILGGGFSGRLMRTVRDDEGLTYSINSQHTGHNFGVGGHWYINASFNPDLFQKGLESTLSQLEKWTMHGVTEAELEAKKANLIGSFKVGLSTTRGMARTLLYCMERGLGPEYIDTYPREVGEVTLEEVNGTIKKYIDLERLVIIKSGSLDGAGQPLREK